MEREDHRRRLLPLRRFLPTSTDCFAAGKTGPNNAAGLIEASTDGGASWASTILPTAGVGGFDAISCPSSTQCVATGGGNVPIGKGSVSTGVAFQTLNGGATWSAETLPAGTPELTTVDCSVGLACSALPSNDGDGVKKPDASISWQPMGLWTETSGTMRYLDVATYAKPSNESIEDVEAVNPRVGTDQPNESVSPRRCPSG